VSEDRRAARARVRVCAVCGITVGWIVKGEGETFGHFEPEPEAVAVPMGSEYRCWRHPEFEHPSCQACGMARQVGRAGCDAHYPRAEGMNDS